MSEALFTEVDAYLEELFAPDDAVLDGVLAATREAGMPEIQVSPLQGRLLYLLAKMCGARRILEIGTLAGYSAIWLARALPENGRLITLEALSKHAEVAQRNMEAAGVADCVTILVGRALETLPSLGAEPFDLVFIDADKENYPAYLNWALRLTRSGSVIVIDNIVRHGEVLDAASADAVIQGTRACNAALAAETRVESTAVQVVGVKGHDGLAIARVR